MNMKFICLTIFLSFIVSGCSNKNSYIYTKKNTNISYPSASLQKTLQEKEHLRVNLYDFYSEWKGVKYKLGGSNKNGIDCSALIQKAYKYKLNIELPRTTRQQVKLGKTVEKHKLQTGDLIFFKTGKNSRHAGIYIDNGKFIHASTSRGVIISKLNNPYFKKYYWKSQRLINQ